MECNRDEANRAKEIAERKFNAKDVRGAKKIALKAQALYPELDGISQLIATFDIYIAAENKINRESDFYAILGVNPSADDETVRKNYRKLALSLHPDKNKSVGADGAFKYISEAWGQLSDKSKRSAYDDRRNAAQNGGTPGQNGFYNFTKTTTTRNKGTSTAPKDRGTTSTTPPTSTNQKTFWTVCHACKMQYEYLRMYLHQNLLCPNCHEPFLALETAAPNTKVSTKGFKSQKVKNASKSKGQAGGDSSFQWGPFSNTNNSASSAQAATMVQRAYEKVKREREEAQAAIKREEALRRKKKRSGNHSSSGHFASVKKAPGANGVGNDDFWIVDETKGVSSIDSRTQLLERARNEIKKKLHQWSSGKVVNYQVNTKEKEKLDDSVDVHFKRNTIEPLVMDVPDPDFHNFDRQRCETAFKEGQIWAAYDDDDGMPRHYAMIHKVSSVDPFKIKVCWLTSRTNDELDLFSEKAFGEFKIGKHENVTVPNIFSHKVNFTKSENGCYEIYPRKYEVWALYRDWSPEWNDETSNEVKHKYEIVEVDESDEDTGFTVTPLVKVAGFKTVFRRHLNPKEARVFPESEICRFSHQIPSHFLTGQGSLNAIKGCLDLDPAAIPDVFLQVIAAAQDLENMDDDDDPIVKDSGLTSNNEPQVLADVSEQFISINTSLTAMDS